jgi:hypothetical protein
VAPIAGNVLKSGLPIALGTFGGPLGALAGVALNVAGKISASSTGSEADLNKAYSYEGVAERAILGEAAIEAIKYLGNEKCKQEGIFSSMAEIVKKMAPTVRAVAPKLVGAVAEPALRMALDSLNKTKAGTEATLGDGKIRSLRKEETNTLGFGARLSMQQEAFIQALTDTLRPNDAESFLGVETSIGNVICKGLRVSGPIISPVTRNGLPLLARGTEGQTLGPFPFEGLAERAMIGEAALQTLMGLPTPKLQQEGLFDIMKNAIKVLGPIVVNSAPIVVKAVEPIARNLMSQLSKPGVELIVDHNRTWPSIDVPERATFAMNPVYIARLMEIQDGNAAHVFLHQHPGNAQELGQSTIVFARDTYSHAMEVQGLHWPNNLNRNDIFGYHDISVAGLTELYPSLHVDAPANDNNAHLPLLAVQGSWWTDLVIDCLNNPGQATTTVVDGNVVLRRIGANGITIRLSIEDYVALLRQMMLNFTMNTCPLALGLDFWL